MHCSDNNSPSFIEALKVWVYIGLLSFGGPAAQVALMHRVLVDEKQWLTKNQYLDALSFCMLLPGPEAMQLATYAGWRMHGVKGGLAAGLMFVIPGALVILALAMAYITFGQTAIFWLSIWLLPLLLLTLLVGSGNVILELGWFFSKLALVTFGGAYAVLAYMAQDVVVAHQWLTSGQMMDGLGLAETTPGSLILYQTLTLSS